MRTISFNTHDQDTAANVIAQMLLGLPRGGVKVNHIAFDPERGGVYTSVWRHADGTWSVAFRPAGEDTRHRYDNPVAAALVIIVQRHNPEDVTAANLADATT